MAGDHSRYVPRVHHYSDSIGYGVGAATLAGYREGMYFAALNGGHTIRMVGTQSFAGNSGGLAVNPDCECIPGAAIDTSLNTLMFRMANYNPDIVILTGGTNDVSGEAHDATTVLNDMSAWLDNTWGRRAWPWFQIVFSKMPRLLNSGDTVVQQVNAGVDAMVAGKSYADHITIVNPYPVLSDSDYNDQAHPNDTGYGKLAPVFYAGVLAALTRLQGQMP